MPGLALDIAPLPPAVQSSVRDRWRLGLPAAILLHGLLVVAAALAPPLRPTPEPEEAIPVELLRPDQIAPPATRPATPPVLSAPPRHPSAAAASPRPQPEETGPPMITATRMMADRILAKPQSRKAVADLATLAGPERMLQLCNLEAIEQIHAWKGEFIPELLVPYATANERISGTTIVADGAAFLSRHRWYGAKYDCTLSRDGLHVVALRFQVEDEIPEHRWSDLGLPPDSDID